MILADRPDGQFNETACFPSASIRATLSDRDTRRLLLGFPMVANRSDPHGRHDWHSAEYVKDWIQNDVTKDESRRPMLTRMIERIPQDEDSVIRVLDVGAGYGELSLCVLKKFPKAQVVCHDFSEPMHEHARMRLGDFNDRVTYVKSDLSQSNWVASFEHSFDAVVSSIAIHNVRVSERIRGIYHEIAELLTTGGCFLNCDLVFDKIETHLGWLEADLKEVAVFEQDGRMTIFGGFK